MAIIRQPSIAGGEISPEYAARTDDPRHRTSFAKVENFVTTPSGAAANRCGLKLIQTLGADTAKLIPFDAGPNGNYVLVFTNNLIRFILNGAVVMNGGSPLQVVTTYTSAQFSGLRWSQVGDILYIAHASHPLRELVRASALSWSLTATTWGATAPVWGNIRPGVDENYEQAADPDHPLREWRYKVSQLLVDPATGLKFETSAYEIVEYSNESTVAQGPAFSSTNPNRLHAVFPDWPLVLSWPNGGGSTPAYTWAGTRIYKGRGFLYGLHSETTLRRAVDLGETPDYTIQPVEGRNPLLINSVQQYPVAVAFSEQRLILAGTKQLPIRMWFGKTNDLLNFDQKTGPYAVREDPVELELASIRREAIVDTLGLERVFIFTSGGVWTVHDIGADLVPVATKHTNDGVAAGVRPVFSTDTLFYVREGGLTVCAILYNEVVAKYQATDLTAFARHLFDGYAGAGIGAMTYADEPNRTLWLVRADDLLSLTYSRETGVLAWATHSTGPDGADQFIDVLAIKESGLDVLYAVTVRNEVYYVERMDSRSLVDDDWSGDSFEPAFLDNYERQTGPTTTLTGLSRFNGREVKVVGDGVVYGPFTVSGGTVTLPTSCTTIFVGLPYKSRLKTLSVAQDDVRGRQKTVSEVYFDVVNSRGAHVGDSFDEGDMYPWRIRSVSSAHVAQAVRSETVSVKVKSSWGREGVACIEQRDPLPLMVQGVARKVHFGEE